MPQVQNTRIENTVRYVAISIIHCKHISNRGTTTDRALFQKLDGMIPEEADHPLLGASTFSALRVEFLLRASYDQDLIHTGFHIL